MCNGKDTTGYIDHASTAAASIYSSAPSWAAAAVRVPGERGC
jgi:hypothetical protein